MCNKGVKKYLWSLTHVPDWFMTQEQVKTWHEEDYYLNDDENVEWYNAYKKTQGPKRTNKRRVNAHCLASLKMVGLVYARR